MKKLEFNLPSSLLFSLILLTPMIAVVDLVRVENVNALTSARAEIENTDKSINFSQNLGQKLHNGFLTALAIEVRFNEKFADFTSEPKFIRSRPKLHDDNPSENISALQAFESLQG